MTILGDDLPPEVDPDIIPPSETRRVVGEPIEQEESPTPEITTLTDQERQDFSALLTVGRRIKKIDVMGHAVVIQTLKTSDEMRIGLYTKPYLETQGFSRSYQVAVCAAGIKEVNGKPLYQSLSETTDEDEVFHKAVEVVSQYYPIVVSQIYQAVMDLEREFADLAIKLGKLKG